MARIINQVAVFGLGKVGELVALLLADAGFKVVGLDADPRPVLTADGVELEVRPLDVTDDAGLRESLRGVDAVVSCLPYHLNITVAEAAHDAGVHYFDLTEDVPTTQRVLELSATRSRSRRSRRSAASRPGSSASSAPRSPRGSTRSGPSSSRSAPCRRTPPACSATRSTGRPRASSTSTSTTARCCAPARRQMVPAMTEKERVLIGGIELEAALTSGGLGTMCETYEGRVNRLDYKTLRYPGHFRQMHFLFDELNLRDQRDLIGRLLVDAKPPVNDDIVYLHAAVEGVKDGRAVPRELRARLPAARDRRPRVAGHLLDDGGLGRRRRRARRRRSPARHRLHQAGGHRSWPTSSTPAPVDSSTTPRSPSRKGSDMTDITARTRDILERLGAGDPFVARWRPGLRLADRRSRDRPPPRPHRARGRRRGRTLAGGVRAVAQRARARPRRARARAR